MPKTPQLPEGWSFTGFDSPHYTQTPDQLFDELLAPGALTCAELRVLLYIVRRTFGFKRDSDTISLSQITDGIIKRDGTRLDWGAGVAHSTAVEAIKGLEAKGIVAVERRARGEGHEVTSYSLVLRGGRWFDNRTTQNAGSFDKRTIRRSPIKPGVVALSDSQETAQNTDQQQDHAPHYQQSPNPANSTQLPQPVANDTETPNAPTAPYDPVAAREAELHLRRLMGREP